MNETDIEYLEMTWNPIAMRCIPISIGCAGCWHIAMANRLAGNLAFPKEVRAAYSGEGPPILVESRLGEPLRRKKPTTIGVQFMGDLFHKDLSFELIGDIWQTMFEASQHTYLVLTKRPTRMKEFVEEYWVDAVDYHPDDSILPNVWLGVTAENQKAADERIPILLETPATVRFVSCEPLLGPIDFGELYHGLSWCIIGAESGPNARGMNEDWVRSLILQCKSHAIPIFYKQQIINGKKISMPLLGGRHYAEFPQIIGRLSAN